VASSIEAFISTIARSPSPIEGLSRNACPPAASRRRGLSSGRPPPKNSVIVITERTGNSVQNNFVEHRGVPYAILLGTARQQWRVAIYPVPNQLPKERTVVGTREDAEITAHSMIAAWLKKRPALDITND
jgi:hypothetical protein